MKKLIFLTFTLIFALAIQAGAQLYDGITQPVKYRIWIPITTSIDVTGSVSVAPFFGYRHDFNPWLNVTTVSQYNMNRNTIDGQVWVNVNHKQKYYLLSRSIYDFATERYRHTLSGTAKLPLGFMADFTWFDIYNGMGFTETDRLQFLGGWGCKTWAWNAGYSVRNRPGFIVNLRVKVTPLDWLQFRYDGGTRAITTSAVFQFN